MTITPTQLAQVGTYTFLFKACLTDYPTQYATISNSFVITNTCVTGVSLALTAQTWFISSTTAFSYSLAFT